nr:MULTISPECIES: hypothetical protein [unclassified Mesorhizobium]
MEVVGAEFDVVRHDVPVHPAVDAFQILDLVRRLSQFLQARGARRAKRIVGQELVAVEQPDFADRRLADELTDVATGAAAADDGDPLVDEPLLRAPMPTRSEAVST